MNYSISERKKKNIALIFGLASLLISFHVNSTGIVPLFELPFIVQSAKTMYYSSPRCWQ